MKILIYCNRQKDPQFLYASELRCAFSERGVYSDIIEGDIQPPQKDYSAIFVIGGDGTLLRRTELANTMRLPLIGINAGKLGFLTEFERSELLDAVNLFLDGQLIEDKRSTLIARFRDKDFYALNDITLQRIYMDSRGKTVSADVYIDGNKINTVRGDGVIVATPTGSTAYSLSAGGAILCPDINAFSVIPLSAHYFTLRQVVFSAESECVLELSGGLTGGLLADGNLVAEIKQGESVKVFAAPEPTVFLRRKNFNFFQRLSHKFTDRAEGK